MSILPGCMYVHQGQKSALGALELELQAFMITMWVPEDKSWSSARSVSALNCGVISQPYNFHF